MRQQAGCLALRIRLCQRGSEESAGATLLRS
jgi:hypothetical protein